MTAAYYGTRSWKMWCETKADDLSESKTTPDDAWAATELLEVNSFVSLLRVIAFLNVMNKQHHLLFRGQGNDISPLPTLLRDTWRSPTKYEVDLRTCRTWCWEQLPKCCDRVGQVLKGRLPRHRPFELYHLRPWLHVAPWSVIQHYGLWPTPLVDLTSSARVAASFAFGMGHARVEGFFYVFAFRRITGDVMNLRSDVRFTTIRLSAVCPPDTERPHLQEGFLAGNPNFGAGDLTRLTSPLHNYLVARIRIVDRADQGQPFWGSDYQKHTGKVVLDEGTLFDELVVAMDYRPEDQSLKMSNELPIDPGRPRD